jgi:hypothetical protein
MVFFRWIGSMHLVTMGKCGSLDHKEQRLVLLEGGLLEEIAKCFAKFLFWTYGISFRIVLWSG